MFTQMRALHAIQRMRAVNTVYGTDQQPSRITGAAGAWRGLATRYDKTPASYTAGLQLCGSII